MRIKTLSAPRWGKSHASWAFVALAGIRELIRACLVIRIKPPRGRFGAHGSGSRRSGSRCDLGPQVDADASLLHAPEGGRPGRAVRPIWRMGKICCVGGDASMSRLSVRGYHRLSRHQQRVPTRVLVIHGRLGKRSSSRTQNSRMKNPKIMRACKINKLLIILN